MFDLPVETAVERREARKFVKFIKEQGFVMFQESVYVKLSINESQAKGIEFTMRSHLPPKGMISMLTITENQFNSIDFLLGDFKTDIVTDDKKVLEL